MVCCSDNSSRHSWKPSEQDCLLNRGAFFNATTNSKESSCLVSSESSRCCCAAPPSPTKIDHKSPLAMHHPRPPQELKRPRRKSVRFSAQCRIRCFDAVAPQRRLWYSQAEYQALREECFSTVRLVKRTMLTICEDHGEVEDADSSSKKNNEDSSSSSYVSSSILLLVPPSEYTARGLEHLVYEGALEQRHSRRLQSLEAVWFEQLRQQQREETLVWCHDDDDERIAQVSRSITDVCQHEAHVRALQYWNEDQQEQQDEEEENQEHVFFLPPRTRTTTRTSDSEDDDPTLMVKDVLLPSTTTTTTRRTARKKGLVCSRETKKRQLTANCA